MGRSVWAVVLLLCSTAVLPAQESNVERFLFEEFGSDEDQIDEFFRSFDPATDPLYEANRYAIRFGAGHSIGDGVGNRSGYTTFDALMPLWEEAGDGLVFGNTQVHVDNFGKPALNTGLAVRMLTGTDELAVFGVSTWYDYRTSPVGEHDFHQLSFGLEYLSTWFDFRSNVYIPDVTEDRKPLQNRFVGNRLNIDRAEIAMAGVDVEIGTVLPAVAGVQGRLIGGGYHFEDSDVRSATGWRYGGELAAHESLTANVTVSDDDVFGTTVVFGLMVHSLTELAKPVGSGRYPPIHSFRRGPESHLSMGPADRLAEPVRRMRFIVTGVDDGVAAIDPATMSPYTFLHAEPGAGGDGTFENRYGSLTAAMADSRAGDSIVYTPLGGTFTEDVTLADGTRLLSNAVSHTLETQFSPVVLPFSGVGQDSSRAARIVGDVTVANNSELDGFDITGEVFGDAVSNVLIQRNRITNLGGPGVSLTSIANSTPTSLTIRDNEITDGATEGIALSGADVFADVSGNTANGTTMAGLAVVAANFTGTIESNNFRSGAGRGINIELTGEFQGDLLTNNISNNAAEGIRINASAFSGQGSQANARIEGNVASESDIGIRLLTTGLMAADITDNVANGTDSFGLFLNANSFPGNISENEFSDGSGRGVDVATTTGVDFSGSLSGNTANGNAGDGIHVETLSDFSGALTNNTTSGNGGNGIHVETASGFTGDFIGTLTNNTANENGGTGIAITPSGNIGELVSNATVISNNMASMNGEHGIDIRGAQFFGALESNTASENSTSGIRITTDEFFSNIGMNTVTDNDGIGVDILSAVFGGALIENTVTGNSDTGVNIILTDTIASNSLIDAIRNTVSNNNVNPTTMASGSQFILDNTGAGNVVVQLQDNISTDVVVPPAFNFRFRDSEIGFGAGVINPPVVVIPPSTNTGTVGLNGVQVFP